MGTVLEADPKTKIPVLRKCFYERLDMGEEDRRRKGPTGVQLQPRPDPHPELRNVNYTSEPRRDKSGSGNQKMLCLLSRGQQLEG